MEGTVAGAQSGDEAGDGVGEGGRCEEEREGGVCGAGVEAEGPGVVQGADVGGVGEFGDGVDVAHHQEEVGEEAAGGGGGGEGAGGAVAGGEGDADGVGGDGADDGFVDQAHVAVVDVAALGCRAAFGDGAEVGGEAGDDHWHRCCCTPCRWC